MRYAVVINGIVVNNIAWDGETALVLDEGELVLCPDEFTGSIGSTWDGSTFTAPPEVLDAPE